MHPYDGHRMINDIRVLSSIWRELLITNLLQMYSYKPNKRECPI